MSMRLLYVAAACAFITGLHAQDSLAAATDTSITAAVTRIGYSQSSLPLGYRNAPYKADFGGTTSPYKTSFKVDGPVILAGVGFTALGYSMIVNKDDLTPAELAQKKRENVPWFDRGNAGYFDDKANDASYIPFFAAFAMPVAGSLIDKNQRSHFFQVTSLYLEAMSISGALYTLSAGAISRSRPLVYSSTTPYDRRVSKNSQRSFFAGHVSATATATFFAAQVFSDFNPQSRAKPYIWAVAAAVPALVGYYRYEAGQHFLSDILIGYGIGAGVGILVPKLHRTAALRNLSIIPQAGKDYKGLAMVYRIR